jgi:hypothetical protein
MTLHKQLEQKRSYVSCDEQYHVFHDNFSVLVVLIEYVCRSDRVCINFSWSVRVFIFISNTSKDFGHEWSEKWNSRTLLCVENLHQILVQSILVYLQGSQGSRGWTG